MNRKLGIISMMALLISPLHGGLTNTKEQKLTYKDVLMGDKGPFDNESCVIVGRERKAANHTLAKKPTGNNTALINPLELEYEEDSIEMYESAKKDAAYQNWRNHLHKGSYHKRMQEEARIAHILLKKQDQNDPKAQEENAKNPGKKYKNTAIHNLPQEALSHPQMQSNHATRIGEFNKKSSATERLIPIELAAKPVTQQLPLYTIVQIRTKQSERKIDPIVFVVFENKAVMMHTLLRIAGQSNQALVK